MKPRTLIPLVIGLGVGFFAIKMGIDMVQRAKGEQGAQYSVVVAAQPIEVASRIREQMLTSKTVAASLVPSTAFTDIKDLVGRVTGMRIASGVPITKEMLAPPGAEPGLRSKIPPGYRAVSIRVNEETAVAGFLVPGCRVDVSAVTKTGGGTSKLILSDIEVGAVGQSLSEVDPDGKTVRVTRSVTLFLQPDQVPILHSYSGRGRLRLALRGNAPDGSDEPKQSSWSRILAKMAESALLRRAAEQEPPEEVPEAAVRRHVVEVVRGSDVERLVFVKSDGGYRNVTDEELDLSGDGADRQRFADPEDPAFMEMLE